MNPAELLAQVLVDELIRAGVRHVVLCPGSRSAPLAYAVGQAHERGRLELHVRVDERSAGFLALGLAKVSRVPAVVITTSGTALANLHPSVLEAHHAVVPMIVLSADRPAELRGTGANQTTIQPGIFAHSLRYEFDMPAPLERGVDDTAKDMPFWRSTVCRGYAAASGALGGVAGPVHINVSFADPLVPLLPGHALPSEFTGRSGGQPWVCTPQGRLADPNTAQRDDHGPAGFTRTLLVVGDLPDVADYARVLDHAQRAGWPVVAEPFGTGDRGAVLPHGSLLLGSQRFLAKHGPDRVITVGRSTLSRDVAALTRRDEITVEHVSATDRWADPGHVVSRVSPLNAWLDSELVAVDQSWAQAWRRAGQRLADLIGRLPAAELSGTDVAGRVRVSIPEGGFLVVGSSNAVRDLDYAATAPSHALVVGNRGLAGIDGMTSTAIGIALESSQPTTLLLGDLTFLHDLNGLLIGPSERRPDLRVVVLNDDGGGIFATLEYGAKPDAIFHRLFTTPTSANLAALCRGVGARHLAIDAPEELDEALAKEFSGIEVIEVRLNPALHRQRHDELRELARDID